MIYVFLTKCTVGTDLKLYQLSSICVFELLELVRSFKHFKTPQSTIPSCLGQYSSLSKIVV